MSVNKYGLKGATARARIQKELKKIIGKKMSEEEKHGVINYSGIWLTEQLFV